jgi:hypothetical protein
MQPEETERGKPSPFIQNTSGTLPVAIILRVHTNIRGNIIIFHDGKDSKNKVFDNFHVIRPLHSFYRKQGGRNFFHFNILLLKFL